MPGSAIAATSRLTTFTRPTRNVGAPPVLIFGSGLTALGVVRAFGRRGIPSYTIGWARDGEQWSRWYRRAPAEGPLHPSPAALADHLRRIDLERAVLIGCSDDWAQILAALDPDLSDRFHTSLPPVDVITTLVDKAGLADALRRAGVPHPETRLLASDADLRDVPERLLRTSFLKPVDSQRFGPLFGAKALSVVSLQDAIDKLRRTQDAGIPMLLQEYVPGPADAHYFVDGFLDAGGVVRGLFARRRYRMYPADFGNSSYMASVPVQEAEQAASDLLRLLRSTNYRGIFSAEFKRDIRDGIFKLLEVNVRPWWYVEFAARCGVDVCWMYYEDALGRPVHTTPDYRTGERLVHSWCDYKAWRERSDRDASWRRHWSAWIGSHRPTFAWDDPMPAVANGMRTIVRMARAPFGRTS